MKTMQYILERIFDTNRDFRCAKHLRGRVDLLSVEDLARRLLPNPSGQKSTINGIDRPSRIRTFITQQESNKLGHLFRPTVAIQAKIHTDVRRQVLAKRLYHGRIDGARRNAVDPDVPVAFLLRSAPCQANNSMLA